MLGGYSYSTYKAEASRHRPKAHPESPPKVSAILWEPSTAVLQPPPVASCQVAISNRRKTRGWGEVEVSGFVSPSDTRRVTIVLFEVDSDTEQWHCYCLLCVFHNCLLTTEQLGCLPHLVMLSVPSV